MLNYSSNDDILFPKMKEDLFSGVLCDIMDELGYLNQFLPSYIRPIDNSMIICGRAFTVQESECYGYHVSHKNEEHPFGVMFEALDSLKKNDVYICAGSGEFACFGGLMATRMKILGAAGAVVDGYTRDTNEVLEIGIPAFGRGLYAQDQKMRGRVIDYACPIKFSNGVVVKPGDIIFGDVDGVIAIPKEIEETVINMAFEKVHGENMVRDEILAGKSVVEVFKKYNIM